MNKELLIFGSNGALGKGVTKSLLQKDFDKIHLFDFGINDSQYPGIEKIQIEDLSIETNVQNAFNHFNPSKEKLFFLFSTVGGFTGGKSIRESTSDELEKMLNMNLKSSFYIAKYFSRLVSNSAGGSICFTAAYTGLIPEIKKAPYGLSKAALIHLVETLSIEGKEINLSANALAPYIIDTPANREWGNAEDYEKWLQPEEIGDLVYALFKNFNFVSGNVLRLPFRLNVVF